MGMALQNQLERNAFTKAELLVALGITAILIGLGIPLVLKSRESSDRAQCENNLKQIGLACHNFESTFKRLPPLYGGGPQGEKYTTVNNSLKFPGVWGSTHVFLYPYISMDSLFKRGTGNPPEYIAQQNEAFLPYVCPSDPSMSAGIAGISSRRRRARLSLAAGT